MKRVAADVAIVGSGAGGGTVAQALIPLVQGGKRVLVLEKGPRFQDSEFNGHELEMADALYLDGGGFLTSDASMTLAVGEAYGGSTLVYTGTSMHPPQRVIRAWGVPGLDPEDLVFRSRKYAYENNVSELSPREVNENNRLFQEGAISAGYEPRQFPVNLRGCRGSSLCNLGCPNGAKQGTHKVQLPRAEAAGVEVVTRAKVLGIGQRELRVRVEERPEGGLGGNPNGSRGSTSWGHGRSSSPGGFWARHPCCCAVASARTSRISGADSPAIPHSSWWVSTTGRSRTT